MVNINNPAGRLYILLDKFRKHGENVTIAQAWADVFGIDQKSTNEIIILITEVLKLVEETQDQILAQDVDHDLFMRPFAHIPKMFTLGLGHKVSSARNSVSDNVMYGLEHCNDLLNRENVENPIEEVILEDLLASVNALSEEIFNSNLPQELKTTILDNLNNISWSIRHYKIHGAKGLKKATESAIGSIAYFASYEHERPDEEGEKLIKKYGKVLLQVMSAVADAYALVQLTDGAVDAILPLLQ